MDFNTLGEVEIFNVTGADMSFITWVYKKHTLKKILNKYADQEGVAPQAMIFLKEKKYHLRIEHYTEDGVIIEKVFQITREDALAIFQRLLFAGVRLYTAYSNVPRFE